MRRSNSPRNDRTSVSSDRTSVLWSPRELPGFPIGALALRIPHASQTAVQRFRSCSQLPRSNRFEELQNLVRCVVFHGPQDENVGAPERLTLEHKNGAVSK